DPALYQNLNAYNQIFVDTVRQTGGNNASRWLLVPGWNTNIDHMTLDFGFVIPTDNYRSAAIPSNEKRIMISAHYYSPYEFCLDNSSQITQWGSIATDPSKKTTWGHEDYMDAQLAQMYFKFVTQGYPVVIGEYCATDKTDKDPTNNIYRVYFNKMLSTTCKKYGATPVYWDIGVYGPGKGSGLIDRKTYAVVEPEIVDAIMSGISATITPPPTTSLTPTPTGPGAKLAILYKCSTTDAVSGGIRFSFQVRNDDTVTVPLSSVKVRYWYTRDNGKWQSFNCYYAALGSGNIYGNMVRLPLSSAFSTADFYAETGFTSGAGSLSPGANSGEVQITLTKYDNSNYNQSNDYSFNPNLTPYSENVRITAYVNGVLAFGTEPTGATPPTPTPTTTVIPTPTPSDPVITPTPSKSPVATPTPTPTVSQEPGAFKISYTQNDWGSGATVNMIIKNTGTTTINGWKLVFSFPGNQKISNMWCGKYTQSGAEVTVTNESFNGTIAPGGTANFGFNINYSGTNAKPTSFTVNDVAATTY
ncbi:MAG TPA: cellulose binding domain-containing protein, partial [Bacillota bacterium]|nr:cellulose binding domain-containing protein [Bacillota bacterium]